MNTQCLLRRYAWCAGIALSSALHASTVFAQTDLTKASLEDLMNIQITSASRKDQRVMDSAAAVYVITQDDISRSGLTTVPELLRLAPGVSVARIDANKWAIAIRGFNFRWSNKLLVMIDGRSIYSRLLSGVYWDLVNLPPQEIDRIEVVRGPGGSIWGANAVDGVINIITKAASDTLGGLAEATVGNAGVAGFSARYGAALGKTSYRASAQWFNRGDSRLPDSQERNADELVGGTAGFRVDRKSGRNDITLHGDFLTGRSGTRVAPVFDLIPPAGGWPLLNDAVGVNTGNLSGGITHTFGNQSKLSMQGFVDRMQRDEVNSSYRATTVAADVHYQITFGRHDVVTGGEYRFTADRADGTFAYTVTPTTAHISVVNMFAQDEVRFADGRVRLTAGSKIEHDTFGGWGLQPTARALWQVSTKQNVWAAVSRALRTPSRYDRGLAVIVASFIGPDGLPVAIGLEGNAEYRSEDMESVEFGYRADLGPSLSFDASGFASFHDGLQTLEPRAPELRFDQGRPYVLVSQKLMNNLGARTHGVETSLRWRPVRRWQVQGSASGFHITPRPAPGTQDPVAAVNDGDVPAYQWQVRTGLSVHPQVEVNAAVYGYGALRVRDVPAYTRADVNLVWTPAARWSLSLAGQNLFGDGHLEFGGADNGTVLALSSRAVTAHISWRY